MYDENYDLYLNLLINKKKQRIKNTNIIQDTHKNFLLNDIHKYIVRNHDLIIDIDTFNQLFTEFSYDFVDNYIVLQYSDFIIILFILIKIICTKNLCTTLILFENPL